MPELRKSVRHDLNRLTRHGAEEIQVGAFAKRQVRRRLLAALGGVALIVVAGVLYSLLRPARDGSASETYAARLRCASCGYAVEEPLAVGRALPLICPKCGAKTLGALWKCRSCGQEFLPRDTSVLVTCPNCRSSQVGSATSP